MATYLVLLIIPLIADFVAYRQTIDVLTRDLVSINVETLETCAYVLDAELRTLDHIVKRLALDSDVNTFLNMPPSEAGSPDIMNVIRASQRVFSYSIRSRFILDFLLYSKLNGTVITTERVHTRLDEDYPAFFAFEGHDAADWRTLFLDNYYERQYFPMIRVQYDQKDCRVIPYAQSIPFKSRQHAKGTVLGFIDTGKLDSLLRRIIRNEEGTILITTPEGVPLYTSGASFPNLYDELRHAQFKTDYTKSSDGHWLLFEKVCPGTGLHLISAIPTAHIREKLGFMRATYGLAALSMILLGMVAALILAYLNSKPLIELSEIFQNTGNEDFDGHDLAYIRRNTNRIIEQNKELNQRKIEQQLLIQASFFHRLLLGNFAHDDSLAPMLKYSGIDLSTPPFNVIVFQVAGFGSHITGDILIEQDMIRLVLEKQITNILKNQGYFTSPTPQHWAWIGYEVSAESTRRKMIQLQNSMNQLGYKVMISRGRPRPILSTIYQSYEEAIQGMEYLKTIQKEPLICHFDELPQNSKFPHYGIETESRLILATKQGKEDEVLGIIEHVFKENFEAHPVSPPMAMALLDALSHTSLRIRDSFFASHQCSPKNSKKHTNLGRKDEIIQEFLTLCKEANQWQEEETTSLKSAILCFIEKNHGDSNLNLSAIAQNFGFKESYFYHFFHDIAGQSFSSYLENLRLGHAQTMLLHNLNQPIEAIAHLCGYNSSHSFRRAFKRSCGQSPKEYREAMTPSLNAP
ncbi:MAG: helix-turn-helix transcriptional regulator [Spirochaetales bacterium]|nr:helix-turn-helix transcriptional regulator [Spirochaetales bacterium]